MMVITSNQRYAIVTLIFSIVLFIVSLFIEDGFFSGAIGPRHWVMFVSGWLILFSVLLFVLKDDFVGNFPSLSQCVKRLPFIAAILLYAQLLPDLGFLISTPLLITFVGLNFGARLRVAIITGITMSAGCFVLFDQLLSISLPVGMWFR